MYIGVMGEHRVSIHRTLSTPITHAKTVLRPQYTQINMQITRFCIDMATFSPQTLKYSNRIAYLFLIDFFSHFHHISSWGGFYVLTDFCNFLVTGSSASPMDISVMFCALQILYHVLQYR